eukprot:1021312-Prorocentrum_minimum.AAC.6
MSVALIQLELVPKETKKALPRVLLLELQSNRSPACAHHTVTEVWSNKLGSRAAFVGWEGPCGCEVGLGGAQRFQCHTTQVGEALNVKPVRVCLVGATSSFPVGSALPLALPPTAVMIFATISIAHRKSHGNTVDSLGCFQDEMFHDSVGLPPLSSAAEDLQLALEQTTGERFEEEVMF